MSYRISVLAFAALAAACQAGSQSVTDVGRNTSSSAVELSVQLVVLTENPTPVGLPTQLVIAASRLPSAGERVPVSWRALDGEVGPREGSGSLEVDSQNRIVATLTASGRTEAEVLTLSGVLSDGTMRGTFGDRLFFRRAGRFEGQIR